MAKINGEGQAATLSDSEIVAIARKLRDPYRLMFKIAVYTGERWGAILQLKIQDVYDRNNRPRETITFNWATRKQSAGKKAETREIPMHNEIAFYLDTYPHNESGYLFPSPNNSDKPISFQSADNALRNALKQLRLDTKGISTHSTRRTFITKLANNGNNLHDIKALTGHKDMDSLMRYIDSNPQTQKALINSL